LTPWFRSAVLAWAYGKVSSPLIKTEAIETVKSERMRIENGLTLLYEGVLMPLTSFHPEMALFRPGCVNLQDCLCGVPSYASAQSLDFLARTKNSSFPNWKPIASYSVFPDGHQLK
jgi:hypothetical protein